MNATRTFTKKELTDRELPYECDGGSIIHDKVVGNSRWSVRHELIFRLDDQPIGEAYRVSYSVGATESQDERPWENESTIIAAVVREVERTVKVWEPIPSDAAPSVIDHAAARPAPTSA